MCRYQLLIVATFATAIASHAMARAAEPPRKSTKPVEAQADDARHAVLLLAGGPLHVRMQLTMRGKTLVEARRAYAEKILQSLDTNGDGKLTREEASKSPLLRTKQRDSAKPFLQQIGVKEPLLGLREIEQTVDRDGTPISYRQDESAAKPDQEVFKFLDKNGDGIIDADDVALAAERLLQKDQDGDQCITFDEFAPPPATVDPLSPVAAAVDATPPKPVVTAAEAIRDASAPFLGRRLLGQYDRDRSRTLSAAELNWSPTRVAALDRNGDKQLSESELDDFRSSLVDLDLAVELDPPEGELPSIRILSADAERLDDRDRPDFAKVRFRDAIITVSHRHIDPTAKTLEAAMKAFNRLDVDANGYLDRSEVKTSVRFEAGLFELMDVDNDGKVFGDEMKQYVAVRGQPAAQTCRVNLYDTGAGFFLTLDRNGDGRISERERRSLQSALALLDRDGRPGITEKEPVRHFHLEFVRGTYLLFGAPEQQVAAQMPAFQRRPASGPSWFQAMDRNNDGDLSWEEFQASRHDFDHIDADGDGLIDLMEAQKAEEEYARASGAVATGR